MATKGMRTKKGNPTTKARKKTGTRQGKFPIFDQKSALSAIKLRHSGKGVASSSVLNRAAGWGRRHKNQRVLSAVKRARGVDRKK